MKILSLTTENVKRVRAIHIVPAGSHVSIVGQNEQGKTSLLDSIEYALRGQGSVCERPIRDGQSSAKSIVELDDYLVTRTFTASGGGTLKVEAKNPVPGTVAKLSSPQAVLDAFLGDLSFDPLEFTRAKPEQQADLLRKLAGIDTTALDGEYAGVYLRRTEVNREASALAAKLGGQHPKDLPVAETDVKDIIAARTEADRRNSARRKARGDYNAIIAMTARTDTDIISAEEIVASLERQLKAAGEKLTLLRTQRAALVDQKKAFVLPDEDDDLSQFDRDILNAQSVNQSIRENNTLRSNTNARNALIEQSVDLTKRLEDIEAKKAKLIAEAKYPIVGLGFSSTGAVTFNGIPFEQLSTAQRLKISAAIGIALNPKLRVMLIRDGSVMDDNTLAELIKVAETHDTQLWIERVGKSLDGQLPGVIIEDGSVVASTLPKVPEATGSKNTACV